MTFTKTFFCFFLLITLCACNHKSKPDSNTTNTLVLLDEYHNFGIISLSNPIDSFDYKYVNVGTSPVVVLGVDVSCDCTTAKYSYDPIMPGDTSYIRVIYNGTGRVPEHFNKSVSVITSASDTPFVLTFDGELK